MSRTLILAIVIAAIGAGGYYYLNQGEQTPTEQLQSAAQDASEAVSEAATAAQEATTEALDSATEQASDAASSLTGTSLGSRVFDHRSSFGHCRTGR